MNEIYLVLGVVEYEGSSPIRAFEDCGAANDFCEQCNAYSQMPKPAMPSVEDDDVWDEFARLMNAWRRRHPAGEDEANNDRFFVCPIPLVSPNA